MAGSQSLERGLELLELLDSAPEALGIREMSRIVGLSPTIVQRLINTLAQRGYIHQDPILKKYSIGYKTFGLGWRLTRDDRLISASVAPLQELASKHFLNAYLGAVQGNRAVYLLVLQSEGPIAIRNVPGSLAYLHSTAMGKVLLAYMPSEKARELITAEPLHKLTARTQTDPEVLMEEIRHVREAGFSIIRGENLPGVSSVGAPVFDFSGSVLASVSIAYPDNFFSAEEEEKVVTLVRDVGKQISANLGYQADANNRTGGLTAEK